MPKITIIVGTLSQSSEVPQERIDGIKYITKKYNETNGTNLTPVDFMFQMLGAWSGDAVNQQQQAMREAIFKGFVGATPEEKEEGLQLWKVQSP